MVMESLKKYRWPGNIRELENVLERAYVLSTSHFLKQDHFPAEIICAESTLSKIPFVSSLSLMEVRRKAIEAAEKNYLRDLLVNNMGRLKDSAEAAGITTRQLHKLMFKHGMHKEDFK
jgi:DNA-binding NtrC family response regulator